MNNIQDYIKKTYSTKEIIALATREFTIITIKAYKLYSDYHLSIDAVCKKDNKNYLDFVWEYCNYNSTIKHINHLKVEFVLKKLAREFN